MPKIRWTFVFFGIVVSVVIIAFAVQPFTRPGGEATAGPTGTPRPTNPTSTPTFSTDDPDEEDSETIKNACQLVLAPDRLDLLIERVYAYENFWQMVDSSEKQAGIETYGTPDYVEAHSVFVDPTLEVTPLPIDIDRDASDFGCIENPDGTVRVSLRPYVRPYLITSQGAKEYQLDTWYFSKFHLSDWRFDLDADTWFISAER